MKITDIITTQHGKTVIASGQHRQPVSEPILEEACYNCKYHYIKTAVQEPCSGCYCKNGRLTRFKQNPMYLKPSRESTEQIIMEHMKFIRDAYKGYCDADIQRLYLCFTDGKISFFNNFWKEDSGTPINKYEED